MDITLVNGQSAYDVVGDCIIKFWENNCFCDVLVSVGTSYDGVNYCKSVEIATPTEDLMGVEFLNDWHEGEKYIKVFGIKSVCDIKITDGEGIK